MATKKATETEDPPSTGTSPEEMSIWERLVQPRMTRTLEHSQIAAAAIEIADEDGLDAVSMRRLASHLGVATMALYRYVSSKEDILWLMVDAAAESMTTPTTESDNWRTVMRGYAEAQRDALLSHPWMFEAGARIAIHLTPNRMALTERALASLERFDLDADTGFALVAAISAYVWGATGGELTQSQLMKRRGWATRDDLRQAYSTQMRWLMGTGRYPHFQRWAMTATRKDDATWRFTFGLDCLIEGIATRLNI
jgi:AcrR family transcriptional regulator